MYNSVGFKDTGSKSKGSVWVVFTERLASSAKKFRATVRASGTFRARAWRM